VVRNNLASLDITAGAVEGWNPNLDNNVASLALSPDQHTVYIAGTFAHVGSASRSFAAAVDAGTGLATAWDPAPAALVVQVAVSGDGSKVFLAERGSSKTGNRLQAWNTAGSGSLAWEHRADGDFQAVAVSSAYVYAGGHFATVDGEAHLHLVALDVNSGAIQSWPPFVSGGLGHGVFAIDVTPSTVTVGGDFERAGDADPANALTIVAQGVARFPNSPDPFPTTTTTTTTTQPGPTTTTTTTTAPGGSDPGAGAAADKAGYWMIGSDGAVYSFGDAGQFGGAVPAAGTSAVDLEPTPSGRGATPRSSVSRRPAASPEARPSPACRPRPPAGATGSSPAGGGRWTSATPPSTATCRRRSSTPRCSTPSRRPPATATTWWPGTAASSPSATPSSTARWGTRSSTPPWSRSSPPATAPATGWWRRTAGSSPSATLRSRGR